LSRRLDRSWPSTAVRFRRLVLFLWWNVVLRLGAKLRGRMRNDRLPEPPRPADLDRRPDIAPDSISLPVAVNPIVSVVIPTYGQLGFTLRCLASIEANLPSVPIEVIVVDDAFPGTETEALGRVSGIRLIRNEVNLGFIRTCNRAALAAQGQFLMFLNNDTQVRAGWLDRMMEVFAARPYAGIVGSKLIGEDGRLQEAGGILWNDGSPGITATDAIPRRRNSTICARSTIVPAHRC